MRRIGAHVSTAGGVQNAPGNAAAIGAKAFALFIQNPRQWKAKPLTPKVIEAFRSALAEHGYHPRHVVPHVNYLINLGHQDAVVRDKSFESFLGEMQRAQDLGLMFLNFHPGSHPGENEDDPCLQRIADAINRALDQTHGVTALLENTAGQGSSVAHRFDHIAEIIEKVEDSSRVAVCLDTCHAFAAGYDLRNEASYQAVFNEFDQTIGLDRLKAFHLNDAKSAFKSRVDRHESLGKGNLGLNAFDLLMKDARFDEIPMILETIDDSLWPEEIQLLYRLAGQEPG